MKLPIDTDIFPEKTGVYVVGGSIRDLLIGRKPLDYDLTVQRDAELFARRLAGRTSGHVVDLGKQGFQMMRVVTGDHFYDITPINGKDILSDLRDRDFTINAMAIAVSSGVLIDPLEGQKDLAAKKVRMVSREVFRKDPVRLVRAYRMAASFDFGIDKSTQEAIAEDAYLVQQSAGERVREELFKILHSNKSHVYLSMMAQSGLILEILPEFAKLKQSRVDPKASRTWFEQTLDAYYRLEKLLNSENDLMRSIHGEFFQNDHVTPSIILKWSALFHNLGRLPTKQSIDNGKLNVNDDHADRSADMARAICQRLRFSRRHSETIELVIRYHFKPIELFGNHQKNKPVEKEFIRLFLNCSDTTPDVLLLALAEFQAQKQADDPALDEFTDFIRMLFQKYDTELRPRSALPSPVDGNDLINEFGMKPSSEFKHLLKRVQEERLAKESYTREEALELVRKILNQK